MATHTVSVSSVSQVERVAYPRVWSVGLLATAAAVVANLLIYGVASSLFAGPREWPGTGVGAVIGSSVGFMAVAVLVFAALGRFTRRPITLYRVIAVAALIASLALPISAGSGAMSGVPAADTATVITFIVMHIVSAAIAVGLLTTRARAEQ